jgi:MFS family permease
MLIYISGKLTVVRLHAHSVQINHTIKSLLFLRVMMLFMLADSIMSYVFPVSVEHTLGSSSELGVVMALSSVAGLSFDLWLPSKLRHGVWSRLLLIMTVLSLLFPLFTLLGIVHGNAWLFIIASIVWGLYFELLGFSQQDFAISEETPETYNHYWGNLQNIWSFATLVGPIIGGILLSFNQLSFTPVVVLLMLLSFTISVSLYHKIKHRNYTAHTPQTYGLRKFINTMYSLWPVMFVTFMQTCVVATFWTVGGLFGEEIAAISDFPEWSVIALFSAAYIIVSALITRLNIQRYKKRYALLALGCGGLLVSLLFFVQTPILILAVIFTAGLCLAFVNPFNDAVYSDMAHKNPQVKYYVSAWSRISFSLGYIIAPLVVGFMAEQIGYQQTLATMGIAAAFISGILLLLTPLKLHKIAIN